MHQPWVVHVKCILRWCADNTAFINFAFGKWNHPEMFFKRNQWQICNMCLSPKQVSSEMMNSWEDEICTFCRLFAATYLQMCINLPIFSPPALLWDVSGFLSGIFIMLWECWRTIVFYPGESSQKMGLGTGSFMDQPCLLCISDLFHKMPAFMPLNLCSGKSAFMDPQVTSCFYCAWTALKW